MAVRLARRLRFPARADDFPLSAAGRGGEARRRKLDNINVGQTTQDEASWTVQRGLTSRAYTAGLRRAGMYTGSVVTRRNPLPRTPETAVHASYPPLVASGDWARVLPGPPRPRRGPAPRASLRASSWRVLVAILLAAAPCFQDGWSIGSAPRPGAEGAAPRRGGWFTDVARDAGIDFTHFLGATGRYYFAEIAPPGCALLDYDNDGDLDVYSAQGSLLEPGRSLADAIFAPAVPLPPRSRLFRNELASGTGPSGTLRFTEVTEQSRAGWTGYGMGVATGDYDNDGDVDLYLTYFGPDALLRNNGDGTFTDATARAGLGDPRWTSSATFFDYDRDGYLDLFVAAYADFTLPTNKRCFSPGSGARDYCGPKAYPPLPARLYRNRGDGTFEDVSGRTGVDAVYGHGLGVVAADFDGNRWPDLYVANDGDANLRMNNRGRFTEAALLSGVAYNEHGLASAGMGIAAADYDDDGDVDLFVTNLAGETNTLYENRGDGSFEDVTHRRGVGLPSLPFPGFGTGWIDVDNDVDLDLFVVNGDVRFVEGLAGEAYPYQQPNQVLIFDRQRNEDRSTEAGDAIALVEVGRGAAFGDVDNVGDIDVLVCNNNGPARLLRKELPRGNNWLLLRVVDGATKRDATGSAAKLTLSDGRTLTRHVRTDGSYLSASDPRLHFAWPEGLMVRSLEVVMPDGRAIMLDKVPTGVVSTVTLDTGGQELTR